MKCLTGMGKLTFYLRVAVHVAVQYLFRMGPSRYVTFLRRAAILLRTVWPDKVVKVPGGYKLQLYLPAYPSPAFFYALETKLLRQPPGPVTVVYSMTKACTYKCPHCYQSRDAGKDVSQNALLETAVKMREAGVALFDIEGGEPFLKFDRLKALVEVFDHRSEVWVNTSGAHVDRGKLTVLRDLGLFGLMISIHAPVAQEHDRFTGVAGSFQTALQAIELAKELGVVVAINSVLTREQLQGGQLEALMALARQLDSDFVQLIHPKPAGKWLTMSEQIEFQQDLIAAVLSEHRRYNSGSRKDYPALAAQVFEERQEAFGCTAGGVDRFYINAAGEVQPCEFLNISFGNINREDFGTIFSRMRSYFQQPCSDWLCCTQAHAIAALMEECQLSQTPILWPQTKELVESWDRGQPTALYAQLGVYSK